MTLMFNENEYMLERFSYTITNNQEKRINCILDGQININLLISTLENDFDGNIIINTSVDQFSFTGCKFDSLDISEDSLDFTFIAINFSK